MPEAVETLREAGFAGPHVCAIVAGTGLGRLADALEDAVSRPYADIVGFPGAGVSGHRGRLHRGSLSGRSVLVFEGRSHAYEHGDAAAMRTPIALARALGATRLLLTCAAGSMMREAGPGSLVRLTDHINLSGMNPLIGEPSDARFVPMTRAYDPDMAAGLDAAAEACGFVLHRGVYAWFSGPSFETPAEVRMAGLLGADLVGMSTVPEVILARFFGLAVAAVSVVTNRAAGIGDGDPYHAETKQAAAAAADDLVRLLRTFVAGLPAGDPVSRHFESSEPA